LEWEALARLALTDIVPVIADLSVRMNPRSQIETPDGKAVTFVDPRTGMGLGLVGWADPLYRTTSIEDWAADPRHSAGIITRNIRAIDIDVPDEAEGQRVEDFVRFRLGIDGLMLPKRDRENSGKRLLLYRMDDSPENLRKYVVNMGEHGAVEFLGNSQQFVAAGTHPSGARYRWPEGIPASLDEIPLIPREDILDLARAMVDEFSPAGWSKEWRWKRDLVLRGTVSHSELMEDPAVAHLIAQGIVRGYGDKGEVYVECPWAHEHTTPDKESATAYYPAGTNGREAPGFRCLHGHCEHRTFVDFIEAVGYRSQEIAAEFEVTETGSIPPAAQTRPKFTTKGKSSLIAATLPNTAALMRWTAGFGYHVRYDQFKDMILYRATSASRWSPVTDDTYTEFRLRSAAAGMEPTLGREMIRDAVSYVAREQTFDSATAWLESLQWDGTPRLAQFHVRCLHLPDTPYHQAAMLYLWTALAGRVMDPGAKADMVPILIGRQGQRKSTFVTCLAPSPDEYTNVSLSDRDADLSRQLRGRMAVEWAELRGLETRDMEAIKDWVSRQKDDWVPKFKEFATTLLRRFIIVGTTNKKRFLNDPTGLRRWLPLSITEVIDIEYLTDYHAQLWAEAREMWRQHGIMWREAEMLAVEAQRAAMVRDIWEDAVRLWLRSMHGAEGFTTLVALHKACSIPSAQANGVSAERMRRVLWALGWDEEIDGRWYFKLT